MNKSQPLFVQPRASSTADARDLKFSRMVDLNVNLRVTIFFWGDGSAQEVKGQTSIKEIEKKSFQTLEWQQVGP